MVDNRMVPDYDIIGAGEILSQVFDTLVVSTVTLEDVGQVRVRAVAWFEAGGFVPVQDDPADVWPYLVTVWSALSGSGLLIVDEADPSPPEWLPAGGRWADRVVIPPCGSVWKRAMEDAGMIIPGLEAGDDE
jgi:hypothetical protein